MLNLPNLPDDALLPSDRQGLEASIREVEARQIACVEQLSTLLAAEDYVAGIFHAEDIHRLKQTKVLLQYQKDLRKARLNRLALEE